MSLSKVMKNLAIVVASAQLISITIPVYSGIADAAASNDGIITSNEMSVELDQSFPRVIKYEINNKVLHGSEEVLNKIRINGTDYVPKVTYTEEADKAHYVLTVDELNVVINLTMTVKKNTLDFEVTKVEENGTARIHTIEFPDHSLVSVRSTEAGAKFAGSRMETAVYKKGDVYQDVSGTPAVDTTPRNYMYAFINNDQLAAGVWSNAYGDTGADADNDNHRIVKQTTKKTDYSRTALWSASWVYRGNNMPNDITEPLPHTKVVITEDANADAKLDWQDAAVAFRDIMNNPVGSDRMSELVVHRIPFNFSSQATNPFLKTLDETKRIYLSTDGLGQWVELKGYQAEGHDSAHPDYGGHIGVRQGGQKDMDTLVREAQNYNAFMGVHISGTGAHPEAKAFDDQLVNLNKFGWDWLDLSYDFDDPTYRREVYTGNRMNRLQMLKADAPTLDFIYADAWYEQGFNGRRFAREVNSFGWALMTEFPSVLEDEAVWDHWAVDYDYGGKGTKGYSSDIARFVRNHQKDTWIGRHPILGGTESTDAEGWVGRVDYDEMINVVFKTNLPTKYLQSFPMTKYDVNNNVGRVEFEGNVVAERTSDGKRTFTKDGKKLLEENVTITKASEGGNTYDKVTYSNLKYLLPWSPNANKTKDEPSGAEEKLYHYNENGGTTTWELPNSWSNVSTVKLYTLTDTGKKDEKVINVVDGKITIENAAAKQPYVVYKGDVTPKVEEMNWGFAMPAKDPSFNSGKLDNWNVKSGAGTVERNHRGQYELVVKENTEETVLETQLSGLKPGTYSASIYVQVGNTPNSTNASDPNTAGNAKRKTTIGVKDFGGADITNYTESSPLMNYISADSKHSTNMQRMRVVFDVAAGRDTATLYLKVAPGTATVTFDDVRCVPTERVVPQSPDVVVAEDFEHVDQGLTPFVIADADGVSDPRTHLSELHAPYTQKGWNGNAVDDVLNGEWSIKSHKTGSGLIMRTLPQTLRFDKGTTYEVSFKYESQFDKKINFVVGNGNKEIINVPMPQATVPTPFTVKFTASTEDFWIGTRNTAGDSAGDFILDDLVVKEAKDATIEPPQITPVDLSVIPVDGITASATGYQEGDNPENVLDGNTGSLWHTAWDGSDKLPQSITLDLGKAYNVKRVDVTPRQSQQNGIIKKYELYTSADGVSFEKVAEGDWEVNADTKSININNPKPITHVKLTALEGVNGWASVAEMRVAQDAPSITGSGKVEVSTIVGMHPEMPATFKATLSNGTQMELPVQWPAIAPSKYAEVGTFEVVGLINGVQDATVTATVTVTAGGTAEIVDAKVMTVYTTAGTAPMMPATAKMVTSNGTVINVPVTWDQIAEDRYKNVGSFNVTGTVEGTNVKAQAIVIVTNPGAAIIEIPEVKVSTVIGKVPVLPSMLEVTLSDQTKRSVSVAWDRISDEQISKEGQFTVNGTIEGTDKKAVAEITVKEDPNIALKKPATASSEQSGNTAVMANDGLTSTRWCVSNPSTEQWWKVDLGTQYDVTSSKITWETASSTMKYKIEVSTDGENWTTTVDKWNTPVTQSMTEDTWSAKNVKFIKVTALGINPAWAGFREFEAYGAKSTVDPGTVIKSIHPVTVSTTVGIAPQLPANVTVVYEDNTTGEAAVTWDAVDESKYAQPGTFAVNGAIAGTDEKAVANVTVENSPVIEITSIKPVTVSTEQGTAPVLPTTVIALYSDNTEKSVSVSWDHIDESKYSKTGQFTVQGTVSGTNLKATAEVTVTKKNGGDKEPGTPPTKTHEIVIDNDGTVRIIPDVTVDGNTGKVVLDNSTMNKAFAKAVKDKAGITNIVIDLTKNADAKTWVIQLPSQQVTSNKMDKTIQFITNPGVVTIQNNMFKPNELKGYETVEFMIENGIITSIS
ncbi:endo-alpha-N-acetylgalactosaminidase family protein [Paenibacillus sp. KQZ6P-2]|uniref:Endo-alpha-N-acetylgalactosaminidase family protein n=1 Tax=Paenibacillus mangrovi TaxID=2931978 RepID=A0A9X1WKB3_9BACL|nr:endo-alpha-N-acetylgalactosaminidase family protein [Paenibacillus mangrovi]MCJ8010311.1 endo-alpha-N-acetylgalactosaminidase family protein [Paenibacillus mangrovi]